MEHQQRCGTRRGSRLVVGLVAAGTALALLAGPAGAAALSDSQPKAAAQAGARIAELDSAMRADTTELPGAQAAVVASVATLDAARAAEFQTLSAPAAPLDSTSPHVVDAAASAILGDLAPERARSARVAAEQALAAAQAHVPQLQAAAAAASDERKRLLAGLDASGQALTHWSIGLLDRLGAPVTTENLDGLAAWIGAESNNARYRNPLATTMGAPGAEAVNDVGVKSYPSDDTGLDATVRTLRNGFYDPILAALQQGDSALRVVLAVAASPWGTGENAVRRLALDSTGA